MKLDEVYSNLKLDQGYSVSELSNLRDNYTDSIKIAPNKSREKTISQTLVCVPIYNEEGFIKYFLSSLLEQIGITARLRIFLVFNACTDNSKQEAITFLNSMGCEFKNSNSYHEYRFNNLIINLSDIIKRGKIYTLQHCNNYAKLNNYKYLINLDSDFILQNDTLINLIDENGKIAKKDITNGYILSGSTIRVFKHPRKLDTVSKLNELLWTDQKYNSVVGAIFLAPVEHLSKHLVTVINEDYYLGVSTRYHGGKIYKCESARIWGYFPDQQDFLHQLTRSIQGRLQIIRKFPYLENIIKSDHFFIRRKLERYLFSFKKVLETPNNLKYWITLNHLINQSFKEAIKALSKNPKIVTWPPLSSTKV